MTSQTGPFRIEADVILTCDESSAIYAPGAIEVSDGRITHVGPVIPGDAGGIPVYRLSGLLMPGLVNVHCHSAMTLLRGTGEGLPLKQWLREIVWPREALLTDEDVYWGMMLAAAELLCRGVTTTNEMYFFEDAVASAAKDCGIRSIVAPLIIQAPGFERFGGWETQLQHAIAFLRRQDKSLVKGALGPHSAYALPAEALYAVAEAAADHDALVHIHVAETRSEGSAIEQRYGKSAPALLEEAGLLTSSTIAAHSVWLSDADLALFRRRDVAVGHCPQSNTKLGSGIARLSDMLKIGIRVGLGTDGPASNNNLDLWEEMHLASLLARASTGDPTEIPAAQALDLATRGAGEALSRADVGALSVGRWADMALVRMDDPTFVPVIHLDDIVTHIVWAASSRLVTDVWVGGRRVVRDGACLTIDVAEARRRVQDRAARLAHRQVGS